MEIWTRSRRPPGSALAGSNQLAAALAYGPERLLALIRPPARMPRGLLSHPAMTAHSDDRFADEDDPAAQGDVVAETAKQGVAVAGWVVN
jgi:hypothetical protein